MRVDAFPESRTAYKKAGLEIYAETWRIWRSQASNGHPAGWYATFLGNPYVAKVALTLDADTAEHLAKKLQEQTDRAKKAAAK